MKALIVVDMQNDFITGSLGSPEAQAIVPYVVEKVKNFDGDVFYTRDTHKPHYLSTFEGKHLPIEHCIEDTKGWMICDELLHGIKNCAFDRMVFDKRTFGDLDLPMKLKVDSYDDYTEFELCGLCTDICVISNALILRATYPEAKITVDSKACAGVTPEKHEAALEVMRSCQIDVI